MAEAAVGRGFLDELSRGQSQREQVLQRTRLCVQGPLPPIRGRGTDQVHQLVRGWLGAFWRGSEGCFAPLGPGLQQAVDDLAQDLHVSDNLRRFSASPDPLYKREDRIPGQVHVPLPRHGCRSRFVQRPGQVGDVDRQPRVVVRTELE